MTTKKREELCVALCEGLTDEQLRKGPKTGKLWEAFNMAYMQVNILAETLEDVLLGTRLDDSSARDDNGIKDCVVSGATENQLKLWATMIADALEQASTVTSRDKPHEHQTGNQILESLAEKNVDEGMSGMPEHGTREIH